MTQVTVAETNCGKFENGCSEQATADFKSDIRPRLCLLGADYDNSNLGIRALTTGAMNAIVAKHPNAKVQILEYGTTSRHFVFELQGKTIGVDMLNIRFSKNLWVPNHIARLIATVLAFKLLPSRRLRTKWLSRNPWLRELLAVDCALALSAGDSFSDIYGIQRFCFVSLPQILVLLLGKPLVQLPQTIGPFNRTLCRKIASWILCRSTMVYSRDQNAVTQIQLLMPAKHASRVQFCPDLAFLVAPKIPARVDPLLDKMLSHRPVIGFNVSGLLSMGGYTRDNMFGLATDYNELVRSAIRYFIEVKHATVLLIPHLLGTGDETDVLACKGFFCELQSLYPGRLYNLEPHYDERGVKHIIAQCDFFVGARMHACVAALSQCVPTAAMAYSEKFVGVFRSVGVESAVADLRTLSMDVALSKLGFSYDTRERLKAVLQDRIPKVQLSVLHLLHRTTFKVSAHEGHQ